MITVLFLLVVFTLFGMPFLLCQKEPKDILLTPVYGISAFVGIGYFLSANLRMTGAHAMALSVIFIILFSVVSFYFNRYKVQQMDIMTSLKRGGGYLIPGFIILLPAMIVGVTQFFGDVNFDFFYNSQDAYFLSKHSVLEYHLTGSETILPLTWSANEQGRFAVALIGAFVSHYLGWNPLHFNAELLASLILLIAISVGEFSRLMYRLKGVVLYLAVFVIVLSAGYTQGYVYFLLGQISALPLCITILILSSRLIDAVDSPSFSNLRTSWDFYALILLVNALYVFYAILAFFAIAIIGLAVFMKMFEHRKLAWEWFRLFGLFFLSMVLLFVVLRISFITEAMNTAIHWIYLSITTAKGSSVTAPLVFSEYLTEACVPLLFGIFSYPISASLFKYAHFFGYGYSLLLLVIAILVIALLLWGAVRFFKSNKYAGYSVILIALIVVVCFCSASFFMMRSGYSLFKIGSWFVPLLLPIYITLYVSLYKKNSVLYRFFRVCCVSILCLNALSSWTYMSKFLVYRPSLIHGHLEFLKLPMQLQPWSEKEIVLDLGDGLINAWVANELRDYQVVGLTHNLQPLDDRLAPTEPCSKLPTILDKDAILINNYQYNKPTSDIDMSFEGDDPILNSRSYAVYRWKALNTYSFIGQGANMPVHISERNASHSGFPRTFRWIEKGVEVFVYSRRPKQVDVTMAVFPGYVNAPEERHLTIYLNRKMIENTSFDKTHSAISMHHLSLEEGMNCFYLESKDTITIPDRTGSLFRKDVPLDFRVLNFALSQFLVTPVTHPK